MTVHADLVNPSRAAYARPENADARAEAAADVKACRALLRENSRTFFAASLLLPQPVREPALALYAFCRVADDAVDLQPEKAAAVVDLRERLALLYAGDPKDNPADRAFAEIATQFAIPREIPDALIEGFSWDAEFRRYENLNDVYAYATRVAGTVGVMMALLMGTRDAAALARACDLGVAMQLSNIARDVGEDAREQRLYLPMGWMREVGIDPEQWLGAPTFTPALASVVQRLLDAADALYERVGQGVAMLPSTCRPGINAARVLYQEIGKQVERNGFDSVSQRAVVSSGRKAALLSKVLMMPVERAAPQVAPPLAEVRHLIDAVLRADQVQRAAAMQSSAAVSAPPAWWNMRDRALWLIDLFERLERQDRGQNSRGG
jgi:15-cis-phytoene synthase